jgi:hypothetical protein
VEIMSANQRSSARTVLLLGAAWIASFVFPFGPARAWAQYGIPPVQEPVFDPSMLPGFQDFPDDANAPRRARRARAKSATPKNSRQPVGKSAAGTSAKAKAGSEASAKTKDGGAAGTSPVGISFQRDVAPILVANCVGCHSQGRPGLARGKLELTSFAKLMQGTPKEKVIVPGNPDESHLILRVRGDEEPRMPQGGNNNGLAEEAIGKIEAWIKAGARLDAGLDPKVALETYASSPEQVRRSKLAKLSAKERDMLVEKTGRDRWKKTNPKLKPEITSSTHFALFGNLPKDRADNAVKVMETQLTQLKRILGGPATDWVEKVSLYVFNSPKDFVEFARTVENREVDATVTSSGKLAIAEPYVAVVDPQGGKKDDPAAARRKPRTKRGEENEAAGSDRTLAGVLIESLGEAAATAEGRSPRWLAFGLGAFLAAQVEPRSPYYQKLRATAHDKYKQGWDTKASEVVGESDQSSLDEIHGVGFAIVESLLLSPDLRSAFPAFARGMSKGTEKLDEVLKDVYRATRDEFLSRTGDWVAERYGRDQ